MPFFYANFHISSAIVLLAMVISYYHGIPPSREYLIFAYFSSLFIYNIDRYAHISSEDRINCPERSRFFLKNRRFVLSLLLTSLFVLIGTVWALKMMTVLILTGSSVVTLLYIFLIHPRGSEIVNWIISVLKIVLLAGVWMAITGIAPVMQAGGRMAIPGFLSLPAVTLFLLFVVNAMWFDLRDRDGDAISGKSNLANLVSDRSYFSVMMVCSALAFAQSVRFEYGALSFISLHYLLMGVPGLLNKTYAPKDERFYYLIIDLPLLVFPLIEVTLGIVSNRLPFPFA